jgi:hypothetical protein
MGEEREDTRRRRRWLSRQVCRYRWGPTVSLSGDERSLGGNRLTTAFSRQGHYALERNNIAVYPPADITVERIGDLVNYDLSALLGAAKAGRAD